MREPSVCLSVELVTVRGMERSCDGVLVPIQTLGPLFTSSTQFMAELLARRVYCSHEFVATRPARLAS